MALKLGFLKNSQIYYSIESFSGLDTAVTMWAHYEVPHRQESGLRKKGERQLPCLPVVSVRKRLTPRLDGGKYPCQPKLLEN